MKKKLEEIKVVETVLEVKPIAPITIEFNNEGLNKLRDTINEIIKRI